MDGVPTRLTADGRLEEIAPTHCPNGHRLGPNRVLVGWHPCGCAGGSGHRTYSCRECHVVIYQPPHTQGGRRAGDLGLVPPG
jgi:hypothetical protein